MGGSNANNARNRAMRQRRAEFHAASGESVAETTRKRRSLRRWLLAEFGDGVTAPCCVRWRSDCAVIVDRATITADRWPLAGADGGTYRRDNCWPACAICNHAAPNDHVRSVPLWAVITYALRTYRDETGGQYAVPVSSRNRS